MRRRSTLTNDVKTMTDAAINGSSPYRSERPLEAAFVPSRITDYEHDSYGIQDTFAMPSIHCGRTHNDCVELPQNHWTKDRMFQVAASTDPDRRAKSIPGERNPASVDRSGSDGRSDMIPHRQPACALHGEIL